MAQPNEKTSDILYEVAGAPNLDHIENLEKIDTLHNDEALVVLGQYQGDTSWSPQEEKRVLRKIDKRLLPILVVTFGMTFYDKVLLAHAAIFGLRTDLELTIGNRYSFSASIFYLGYICGSYPAVLLAQRYPIHRVIFCITFVWGLCVTSAAGCVSYRGLYAQRFFLGVLESGISPIWMMVVGGWYNKAEQTLRMGVWYSAAAMISMIAPLINYGLGHIKGALAPWRYMFIVAGVITSLWAFVILFVMESDPIHAKSLNEREKFIAVSRLRENNAGVRNTHFKASQLWELLTSAHFWLIVSMSLTINVSNAVPTTFNPIIIASMGFSGFNALLLTIPVGASGVIFTIGTAWLMQKFSQKNWRSFTVCFEVLVILLVCVLFWQCPEMPVGGKLVLIYLLSVYPAAYAIMMNLAVANTAGYTKRALTSSGMFVGYCLGNLIGPFTFLQSETPRYPTGWAVTTAMSAVCAVLVVVYRFVCSTENSRRDKAGTTEAFEHAYEDDLTDRKNKQFRYIY
ncbi:uncharacterized protein Z519_12173 [Cladophialophora bantiana CBS 173.52]|uniref:Major facilitator superfamily (MFS) profile domain-containing protein n=1 Tax=Cladophialophora bantiana (strain ATCC 10958 / CBS 173.52 / CDC B-1940 / NIH 8579) TaxID=1442370 RepID=A0A0D2H8Q3_CLAB1|nr:uncharacterized protein Z519_12173 [Cladophialophora bantiana CBS 173.52]KIW87270.1 hypothetical protein Z519_12173 [Cladophialophora bantiana CBS 173.52]